MADIEDRARAALDGLGEPGMYDDYDQACQWSGIVRGLITALEKERAELSGVAEVARNRAKLIDQLKAEKRTVEANARYWESEAARWMGWHKDAVEDLEYYSDWFAKPCCYPLPKGDDPRADLAKHLSRLQ